MQDHNSPTWKFHVKTIQVSGFRTDVQGRLFNPDQWAQLFKSAGAAICGADVEAPRGFLPLASLRELELE
jgi:hypothetical protein